MKKIIASLILGEDVNDIYDKIHLLQIEAADYKAKVKNLLQKRRELEFQKIHQEGQQNEIRTLIGTIQNEIEIKEGLNARVNDVKKIEEEIQVLGQAKQDCSLNISNLSKSIILLNQEITELNVKIVKLESEITKYKEGPGEEDKSISDLKSVNSDIANLQKWLTEHSCELTAVQRELSERLKSFEKDSGEIEPPKEDSTPVVEKNGCGDNIDKLGHVSTFLPSPEQGQATNTAEVLKRKKRERVIKEILDLETGDIIIADDFFTKPIDELEKLRALFQECISQNKHRFICPKCLEMIRISGRGDERGVPSIFTHKNDSVYCKRTTTGLSIEEINRRKYGLVGQSERHKLIKQQLYDCLTDTNSQAIGIENVVTEKRVYSLLPFFNFRQPDVQIEYEGKKIVFEVQLSTTFLSVINERDTFYRLNGYYIIWVFNFEDNRKYIDLNNLAMKDIYFANKWNAFIFDKEARQWSADQKQLVLKCNWLEPDLTWHYKNTEDRFGGEAVTLDQLHFDTNTYKPYFFDAEKQFLDANPEKVALYGRVQKSCEEHVRELEQLAQDKERKRQEAIDLVKLQGGRVLPYEEKKKTGFKYGATVIIEPKYTSYEERADGTFLVGYGPHKGLINQYGEIVIPCKSTDIRFFDSQLIVYKTKEDKVDFWRIPFFEDYELAFKKTDFWTSEIINKSVLAVRLCSSYSEVSETIYCWNDSILLNRGYMSWHIYDKFGNSLSQREYDTIEFTDESKAKVTVDDVEGYINSFGEEIPIIEEFPDGYKSANFMGKYCLINSSGASLSDYSYDAIDYFSDGIYIVGEFKRKEYSKSWYGILRDHVEVIKQFYLADRDLHPITPFFSRIDKPINGIAYAYSGSGKGYDYESGEMHYLGMVYQLSDQGRLIPNDVVALPNGNKIAKYGVEWNLHGKQEGKYKYATLLNKHNDTITECYSEMEDIGDGYIIAKKRFNEAGVITYDGTVLIPFEYEQIKQIEACGIKLLSVKKDGKYGRMDFNRRIIVPVKFDNLSWYNSKPYIIAERHRTITKEKRYGRRTSYQSYIKKICGLYHISGKKILDVIYSSIKVDDNMVVHYVLNGRKGYLDENGDMIFEQTINIPLGQTVDVSIKSIDTVRKFILVETSDGKQAFVHWSWLNNGNNLSAYKIGDKLKLVNSGFDEKRKRFIWKEALE